MQEGPSRKLTATWPRLRKSLRVKLGNKATKAAARIAAEGVVAVYLSDDRKLGAILEVNSETDFVAKNSGIPADGC